MNSFTPMLMLSLFIVVYRSLIHVSTKCRTRAAAAVVRATVTAAVASVVEVAAAVVAAVTSIAAVVAIETVAAPEPVLAVRVSPPPTEAVRVSVATVQQTLRNIPMAPRPMAHRPAHVLPTVARVSPTTTPIHVPMPNQRPMISIRMDRATIASHRLSVRPLCPATVTAHRQHRRIRQKVLAGMTKQVRLTVSVLNIQRHMVAHHLRHHKPAHSPILHHRFIKIKMNSIS